MSRFDFDPVQNLFDFEHVGAILTLCSGFQPWFLFLFLLSICMSGSVESVRISHMLSQNVVT